MESLERWVERQRVSSVSKTVVSSSRRVGSACENADGCWGTGNEPELF